MDIIEEIKHRFGDKTQRIYEKNVRRYYIDIKPEDIVYCAEIIFKELGCRLITVTGLDTPEGFELLYHFSFDKTGKIITLRVVLRNKEKPEIDSITRVTIAAEWIEREIWEMLGVNFIGHPNLKRLLLAPDWPEGVYPLRQK